MGVAYTIRAGDSLSALTRDYYGDVMLYEDLWLANKDKIPNMNNLTIGMTIDLPDVLNGQKRVLNPGQVTSTSTIKLPVPAPKAVSVPIPTAMNMQLIRYAGIGLAVVAIVGLVVSLTSKKAVRS